MFIWCPLLITIAKITSGGKSIPILRVCVDRSSYVCFFCWRVVFQARARRAPRLLPRFCARSFSLLLFRSLPLALDLSLAHPLSLFLALLLSLCVCLSISLTLCRFVLNRFRLRTEVDRLLRECSSEIRLTLLPLSDSSSSSLAKICHVTRPV